MNSNGSLSVLKGPYASLCVLMCPNKFLQVLMRYRGSLCVLMGFYRSLYVVVCLYVFLCVFLTYSVSLLVLISPYKSQCVFMGLSRVIIGTPNNTVGPRRLYKDP